MRRRGAALCWFYWVSITGWGSGAPLFRARLFRTQPFCASAFLPLPLPSRSHLNPRSLTRSQGLSPNPNRPVFFGVIHPHPPKNRK